VDAQPTLARGRTTAVRPLWVSLGCASVVCAVAGIVLPLVPTTPFLLLAAYAFAKGSPRLHDWLVRHPRFGPPIADWRRDGSISRTAKFMGIAAMLAALALTWGLAFPAGVVAIQAVVLSAVSAFLLTRPTRRR
jgi:uncharacterized membrane protein YbaN (DUF454 family)